VDIAHRDKKAAQKNDEEEDFTGYLGKMGKA
jgi:hypothetical protein